MNTNKLNNVSLEFSAEELEGRVEMQVLGFSVDPSIVTQPDGSREAVPVIDGETGRIVAFI